MENAIFATVVGDLSSNLLFFGKETPPPSSIAKDRPSNSLPDATLPFLPFNVLIFSFFCVFFFL